MSNIDKQAVQAVADLKAGYTLGHADVEIIQQMALDAVTLLDELEAADATIAFQQREIRTLLVRLENANRAAMLQGAADNSPVVPDGWVACSEQMPEDEQEVIVQNKMGYRYVSYFDEHSGLFFDMRGGNQMNCIEHIFVTHWMPLPAAPQQEA
ncbi:DUF551 domain-containing protein [Enterobacter hormaechei]|uniref:DUF551 domain-containing protein n=1 Tax=Enterobacter hormaechei TaxID=158836 RepID=UPI001258D853|nr:DUF551 domain-containing protein [Enterobacter hormaechei]VAF04107.1 Protein of uncharacterised function (DUF551) [Enterobacter hormaechei]